MSEPKEQRSWPASGTEQWPCIVCKRPFEKGEHKTWDRVANQLDGSAALFHVECAGGYERGMMYTEADRLPPRVIEATRPMPPRLVTREGDEVVREHIPRAPQAPQLHTPPPLPSPPAANTCGDADIAEPFAPPPQAGDDAAVELPDFGSILSVLYQIATHGIDIRHHHMITISLEGRRT